MPLPSFSFSSNRGFPGEELSPQLPGVGGRATSAALTGAVLFTGVCVLFNAGGGGGDSGGWDRGCEGEDGAVLGESARTMLVARDCVFKNRSMYSCQYQKLCKHFQRSKDQIYTTVTLILINYLHLRRSSRLRGRRLVDVDLQVDYTGHGRGVLGHEQLTWQNEIVFN